MSDGNRSASLVHQDVSPFVQHYLFAREHLGCSPFEAGVIADGHRDDPLTEQEAAYVKGRWDEGDR